MWLSHIRVYRLPYFSSVFVLLIVIGRVIKKWGRFRATVAWKYDLIEERIPDAKYVRRSIWVKRMKHVCVCVYAFTTYVHVRATHTCARADMRAFRYAHPRSDVGVRRNGQRSQRMHCGYINLSLRIQEQGRGQRHASAVNYW